MRRVYFGLNKYPHEYASTTLALLGDLQSRIANELDINDESDDTSPEDPPLPDNQRLRTLLTIVKETIPPGTPVSFPAAVYHQILVIATLGDTVESVWDKLGAHYRNVLVDCINEFDLKTTDETLKREAKEIYDALLPPCT